MWDRKIEALAKQSEPAKRLMALDGVGPITATAIVASVGNAHCFDSGRQFAAWMGLVPRQHSSGGKAKLGSISKRGDTALRTLLIHGTRSALKRTAAKTDKKSQWAEQLRARSNNNITAVALANKHARIIWAMLAHGTPYRPA
jgi:transposase